MWDFFSSILHFFIPDFLFPENRRRGEPDLFSVFLTLIIVGIIFLVIFMIGSMNTGVSL
jgi:hypothetical protein